MTLILASASPRRRELLRAAGIAFEVEATDIPEVPEPGEAPRAFAERLALQKATAGWAQWAAKASPSGMQRECTPWVLGADTIVVVDGEILGKPRDAEDAARMLGMLSGRTHEVVTGVALYTVTWNVRAYAVQSETTRVTFSELRDEDIALYVSTGEPMDKAGGYGIQGIASRWIPRIEGDYSNVVGLPVALVWRMLQERGVVEQRGPRP
jgi:septum formation protein